MCQKTANVNDRGITRYIIHIGIFKSMLISSISYAKDTNSAPKNAMKSKNRSVTQKLIILANFPKIDSLDIKSTEICKFSLKPKDAAKNAEAIKRYEASSALKLREV